MQSKSVTVAMHYICLSTSYARSLICSFCQPETKSIMSCLKSMSILLMTDHCGANMASEPRLGRAPFFQ